MASVTTSKTKTRELFFSYSTIISVMEGSRATNALLSAILCWMEKPRTKAIRISGQEQVNNQMTLIQHRLYDVSQTWSEDARQRQKTRLSKVTRSLHWSHAKNIISSLARLCNDSLRFPLCRVRFLLLLQYCLPDAIGMMLPECEMQNSRHPSVAIFHISLRRSCSWRTRSSLPVYMAPLERSSSSTTFRNLRYTFGKTGKQERRGDKNAIWEPTPEFEKYVSLDSEVQEDGPLHMT